jgi:hypothetical protein
MGDEASASATTVSLSAAGGRPQAGLDHHIGEVELEGLDVPSHVAELVRACWELGASPSLTSLRLRQWAHMLGFGGHCSTKSRRYLTTLGALRQGLSKHRGGVAGRLGGRTGSRSPPHRQGGTTARAA